jgi:DNA gyrase subunit B
MYFGSIDGTGLHNLLWEVVGNVLDLHLARWATELTVEIADGWATVRDDGPGISVDSDAKAQVPTLQAVFTRLRVDPTYDGHSPHVHLRPAMAGVGLGPVNALCARLEVETTRGGVRWHQAYVRGRPATRVERIGETRLEGTTVRFLPDPDVFGASSFDPVTIRDQLQRLAWLNPLLHISFDGTRLPARGGIAGWLITSTKDLEVSLATRQHVEHVDVDLALGWSTSPETTVRSFVNFAETKTGTHVDGLWQGLAGLARALGIQAAEAEALSKRALAPGLTAFIHVGLLDPRFGGPTREHLATPLAATAVAQALVNELPSALKRDPRLREYISARLGVGGS